MTDTIDLINLPTNVKDYIESLQKQLHSITSVAEFAESTKIAEIADIRQKYQQELASINTLTQETVRDAVNDARIKFETEYNSLRRKYEALQQETLDLKLKVVDDRDSVLADISRSLRNKLLRDTVDNQQPTWVQENASLEEDMRKAQESTSMLKSVILPMEAEINQLKSQLKETKEKLNELETLPREINISFTSNENEDPLLVCKFDLNLD
ncbi:unnamed protein product [Didymodactylos carnosus]|uniref:Rabaptin coiled-coil domain-containing protein n=1 Tax=Didymodactylos carnosus TaxID=1234261 RepID=A0A813UXQ7_9BILA|nr:unnamed protein product [Didymodactylos carnosus]CAF0833839.1 unnamed protein product [Didymodactylos carnosus]CAF3561245.1 unnamed protein product [Didymodactylos carnosus]CAF3620953.1 unnamed protein product [Didymodactylos carnosus]